MDNPLNFVFGGNKDVTENNDINPKTKHEHGIKNRKKFDAIGDKKVSRKNKSKTTTPFGNLYQKLFNLLGLNKLFSSNESLSNNCTLNSTKNNARQRESLINNVFISGNNHKNGTEPSFNITQDININSYQVNNHHYNISPKPDEDVDITNNEIIADNASDVLEPSVTTEDNLNENKALVEEGSDNTSQKNSGEKNVRNFNITKSFINEESSSKKHVSRPNSEKRSKGNSKYKTPRNMEDEMEATSIKPSHHLNKNKIN